MRSKLLKSLSSTELTERNWMMSCDGFYSQKYHQALSEDTQKNNVYLKCLTVIESYCIHKVFIQFYGNCTEYFNSYYFILQLHNISEENNRFIPVISDSFSFESLHIMLHTNIPNVVVKFKDTSHKIKAGYKLVTICLSHESS